MRLTTPEIVEEAAKHLKNGKSDPIYAFSSDCFKNGTKKLFNILAVALRSFLVHGSISVYLLLATLVPIIKDRLGSIQSSKNYRSIAISSLVLKLLDWVFVLLFGDKLKLDDLQFAYQPGASTTMCTWSAIETVGYFLRNGSEVFSCLMDMTKAFDLVQHSLLFQKLICAGIPRIFIRIIVFIYMFQFANVRWSGVYSDFFSLCNGVRQGAIVGGILYCFYVNGMFEDLRRRGYGCRINGTYFGVFGYSDDTYLLAPSLEALQEMLKICEAYALEHNLCFSTDPNPRKCKTKCLAFLHRDRKLKQLHLCGTPLPWVSEGIHLGNNFENKYNGMKHDMIIKRGKYITKNCEILQEFFFSHPQTRMRTNQIFNTHFTGSPIWDIFTKEANMIENSWNRSVRCMFDLPLQTHRSLIEPVSGVQHLKFLLIKRFLSFLNQIRNSPKCAPQQLLEYIKRDTRSITGSNLRNILMLTDKDDIDDISEIDIESLKYHELDEAENWKVDAILELTDVKFNQATIDGFT